jgi:hypothetical protein
MGGLLRHTRVSRVFAHRAATTGLVVGLSGAGFYFSNCKTIHLETAASARHPELETRKDIEHPRPQPRALDTKQSHQNITDKLRQYEKSYFPERSSGISRYDVVHVARWVASRPV